MLWSIKMMKEIADKTENCSTDDESGDGQSTKSEDDWDSGVSFDEDSEKDIDTVGTADAIDKMEHARIRCCNKTHRKMKWKFVLRIATSQSERWIQKAAEWIPELSSRYRTNRTIDRPKKKMRGWHQRLPQTKPWRKRAWGTTWKKESKQQHLDQYCQRSKKNGLDLKKNTQGNVQNDRKEICNVVLEQRQQHSDQE